MTMKCEWCGNVLSSEEIRNPNSKTEKICDDCFHDHYEFTCCRCQNYGLTKHQHRFIVVFDGGAGVDRGIYEVINYPYFGGSMFSSSIFGNSVRKIMKTIDFKYDDYPCGHLCLDCQHEMKLRQSQAGKLLHQNDE